jgi:hypothetical protein
MQTHIVVQSTCEKMNRFSTETPTWKVLVIPFSFYRCITERTRCDLAGNSLSLHTSVSLYQILWWDVLGNKSFVPLGEEEEERVSVEARWKEVQEALLPETRLRCDVPNMSHWEPLGVIWWGGAERDGAYSVHPGYSESYIIIFSRQILSISILSDTEDRG